MPASRGKPLILVDRDGTLIEERDYLGAPDKVRLLPGAAAGLRRLKQAGFRVVVVSNQSGVGRGILKASQVEAVNQRFLALLKAKKAAVDGLYWCPHRPSAGCACRKPKLSLVKKAARVLDCSWKGCVSVGDRPSDIQLGQRTGGQGVLVLTGYGRRWRTDAGADHIARDFNQAVSWILKESRRER